MKNIFRRAWSKAGTKIAEMDKQGPFDEYPFSSYSKIYEMLMANLNFGIHDPGLLIQGLLFLLIPASLAVSFFNHDLPIQLMVFILVALSIFIAYGIFVIAIGVFAIRDPHKKVPIITLRLLAGFRQPYKDEVLFGLTFLDIERIKRIAQIEQSAADWKGSITNTLIIGSLSAIVASVSVWGKALVSKDEAINFYNIFGEYLPSWLIILFSIAIAILIIWAAFSFLIYLVKFLSRESSNQTIILACEEAQALLESLNLHNEETVEFRKRLAVVEKLDFVVVKPSPFHFFDLFIGESFIGPDQHLWHIIPKAQMKNRNNLASAWIKFLKALHITQERRNK